MINKVAFLQFLYVTSVYFFLWTAAESLTFMLNPGVC